MNNKAVVAPRPASMSSMKKLNKADLHSEFCVSSNTTSSSTSNSELNRDINSKISFNSLENHIKSADFVGWEVSKIKSIVSLGCDTDVKAFCYRYW